MRTVRRTAAAIGRAHRAAFETQRAHPEYAASRRDEDRRMRDDHDFGFNNAGAEVGAEAPRSVVPDFSASPGLPEAERAGSTRTTRSETRSAGNRSARLFARHGSTSAEKGAARRGPVAVAGEGLLPVRGNASDKKAGRRSRDGGTRAASYRAGDEEATYGDVDVSSSVLHPGTRQTQGWWTAVPGRREWNEFPAEKKRLLELVERSRTRSCPLRGRAPRRDSPPAGAPAVRARRDTTAG